ncbi:unnamed protein product [Phytophthora fragariaefolia]|uniref:non-specific serine/threonine protein kinase n=1 Tax=Phytophthora fragariaefolia TaxID=1490495 RepID=A0A9W7CQ30_9STRA|nr:unnamed protein product [Phytophthora fragariaefolia]
MRESDNVSKRTTAMYRSPELADVEGTAMFGSGELTEAVDVWAMGCVLYSMAFFKSPFPLEGLRTDRYTIPSNSPYSLDVHAIIARMLTADVEKRATIEHIMDCIDEIICGHPLPPLPSASKKKKEKVKVEAEKDNASATATTKKAEARKETVASKAPDAGDLLGMDFNPTISDGKPPAARAAAPSPFDTTWAVPTEGFADFASFPSPTSFGQTGGNNDFATGSTKVDPFDLPPEPVKHQAPASVFDFDTPPVSASPTPPSAMVSHAAEVDPFAEIDAPPPALLYGGNPGQRMGQPTMGQPHMGQPHMGQPHMGQSHMGQPHMGQPHMGQPHMGQPHMGFQQPQQGFPGGFPMQQQQQMPQQMWGGGAAANQGYHSSNPF